MAYDKHVFKRGTTLAGLQPGFRAKVETWLNWCQAEGYLLFVDFTLRTRAEQLEIYAKGRKKIGPIWIKVGTTVTDAPPGSSYHEYGLAIDVYVLVNGKPDFNRVVPSRVVDLAKKAGMTWGGDWKRLGKAKFNDCPHFDDAEKPPIRVCRQRWPQGWTA